MSLLRGWRPLLRMARREALRGRGRSALVLALIALPVLAVSAAAVVYRTTEVTSVEALDRELGAAAAAVTVLPGQAEVVQGFDPELLVSAEHDPDYPMPTADDVRG